MHNCNYIDRASLIESRREGSCDHLRWPQWTFVRCMQLTPCADKTHVRRACYALRSHMTRGGPLRIDESRVAKQRSPTRVASPASQCVAPHMRT